MSRGGSLEGASAVVPRLRVRQERGEIFYVPAAGAGENVGLLRPETTIPGLQIPTLEAGAPINRRCYPVLLPQHVPAAFSRAVAHRAVYLGEIHSVEEWIQVLQADGVGHHRKGRNQVDPYGDATFRALWNQLGYQWLMPLSARAHDGQTQGLGLARTREQIEDDEASLRRRADRMTEKHAVLSALAESGRPLKPAEGNYTLKGSWQPDAKRIEMVLGALSQQTLTNSQIAFTLATGDLPASREEDALIEFLSPGGRERELARMKRLQGAPIRELLGDLRLQGIAICGGSSGVWIPSDVAELRDYLGHEETLGSGARQVKLWTGLQGRINAVLDNANRKRQAGIFWFPRNQAELGSRSQLYGSVPRQSLKLSPALNRQHQRALQAELRRREQADDESFQLDQEQTRGWLAKTYNSPGWQQLRQHDDEVAISGGKSRLTREQRLLKVKVKHARRFLERGYRASGTSYAAPWTQQEQAGPVKQRAVTSISAAVLAKNTAKPTATEQVPW